MEENVQDKPIQAFPDENKKVKKYFLIFLILLVISGLIIIVL